MSTREITAEELQLAQALGWAAHSAGGDYLWTNSLPDGRAVFLMAMFGSNLRLAIGDPSSPCFDDVWCYQAPQTDLAWRAALGWDGQGDPEGWVRHCRGGEIPRRRPDGTPESEYRAP